MLMNCIAGKQCFKRYDDYDVAKDTPVAARDVFGAKQSCLCPYSKRLLHNYMYKHM